MTKNPKRVAAGRSNRALRPPLSKLSRQKLRDAALANKPWKHSTGPRTVDGKQRVARNGRNRAATCDKSSVTDPILDSATALLKQVSSLRKGLYLDVESIQFERCSEVANQLRDIVCNAGQTAWRLPSWPRVQLRAMSGRRTKDSTA